MDLIDTTETYFKDDEVRLFDDTLLTDMYNDGGSYEDLLDSSNDGWHDNFSIRNHYNGLVSDCMLLSDAMTASQDPHVQSEHRYSISNGNIPCLNIKLEPDNDMELETMNAINPNLALTRSNTIDVDDMFIKSEEDDTSHLLQVDDVDDCNSDMQTFDSSNCSDVKSSIPAVETCTSPTFVVTCTTKLVRRQPTIFVTNARQALPFNSNNSTLGRTFVAKSDGCSSASVLRGTMKDRCKEEMGSVYILTSNCQQNCEETQLPLTPPGSSGNSSCSDSEGSRSPKSVPPSSPPQHYHQQLSSSGMIILTDEEKRTMIAEGYPVPTRLPLTKQEEKNLKKVQRKIKNKMSAQESRRKKKDYVETLEKKLEASNQENSQLQKQVEKLRSTNETLLSQLRKLETLASNLSPLQTSTCLAVFVLFFALGIGIWSPSWSTSIALSNSVNLVHPEDTLLHAGTANDYFTPNMRSRTLKSFADDIHDPLSTADYRHSMLDWLLGLCRPYHMKSVESPVIKTLITNEMTLPETLSLRGGDLSADVTSVIELKPANESWTNSNAQLNVTVSADLISVLV